MKIVSPVWRTLNFDYHLIFCSMKPTYFDGTEITGKKNPSVSQHLLQFLGDKIGKKTTAWSAVSEHDGRVFVGSANLT